MKTSIRRKCESVTISLMVFVAVQARSNWVDVAEAVEQANPSLAEDVQQTERPVSPPELEPPSTPPTEVPSEPVPACPSQPPISESRQADYNGCSVASGGMVCVANPARSATASDLFHYWGRGNCREGGCATARSFAFRTSIGRFSDRMSAAGTEHSNACYICGCYRGRGCFAPGTSVTLADGSEKLVDDLRVGDELWNPVQNIAYTVKQVVEGAEPIPLVELIAGETAMKVSQEHIVYTPDGFRRAKELVAGDIVLRPDGSPTALDSVRLLPVTDGQYVINVVLEGPDAGAYGHLIQSEGFISGDLFLQNNLEALLAAEPK